MEAEKTSRRLTAEQAPGFTSKERDNLGALWYRYRFLNARVAENPGLTFDASEARAIRWALTRLGVDVSRLES